MQSSIWKMVTAVGIVGIGTLVVLEVQQRLPMKRNVPVGQTESEHAAVEIGSPTQEQDFVPAADSEFDRMFANASDGSGLSEPPVPADATKPEVNTVVRRNELADEPSPFSFEEPSAEPPGTAEGGVSDAASRNIKTASFEENQPTENPFPAETPDNSAATGNPSLNPVAAETEPSGLPVLGPGPAAAATPEESATAVPGPAASGNDNSIMFFPGSDSPEAGAPKTAEGTKSAFPAEDATTPEPRAEIPAGKPAVTAPPVTAQSGDDEIPAFDFGGSAEPPARETPAENPFGPSPFSNDNAQPTPDSEQPIPAFPAFDETPPANTEPEAAPVNPRRDPRTPIDSEPAPFERDDNGSQPEPSPFEPDSSNPRGRETDPSLPARSPRPSRAGTNNSGMNNSGTDVPSLDLEPRPEPIPSAGDETFGGDALPFVPDNSETGPAPRTPGRTPAGESQPSRGTETETDFPPLPGIEVPGPREPRSPGAPIDDSGLDPFPPGDSTNAPEARILKPHLTVEKKAPETASVGIPLDYIILVSNEGETPAADVIVEDELSRGVELQTTNPTADYDEGSRLMSWRIPELGPGEKREIRVRVVPTGEGTLNGVATVRFKAQVKASTVITAPKLSVELNCAREVRAGEQVELKYVVRNNGSGDARAVLLRSVLPENLRHPEGNDLEYEIEVLKAGEEQEVTLTVVAAERGECIASAELSTTGIQPVTTESSINVIGELLKVERLGPEKRYVGRASQFQNIISNTTNFEATNVVVMELVPEGMKFVSASESGEYNPSDRLITWKIARIEPNKQVLLDVELTPEHAGSMDSIVQVVESAGFKSQAVKTVSVEDLHNIGADVSQIKGPVAVGEKFTFAITIDNRGTANATNVQLTVQLPKQLKVLAAGSKEQGIEGRPAPGNAVNFKAIQEVPPNSSKTFQLVLQGQEPVKNGVIKAELNYREMTETLVVSESVTVFSEVP